MNVRALLSKNFPSTSNQNGLTLVEIMIALLLGAFILGGVLQVFVGAKKSNKMQDALSRLQENGRFAMEFIGRDIRMADFRACISDRALSLCRWSGGSDGGLTGCTGGTVTTKPAVTGGDGALIAPKAADSISLYWSEQACGVAGAVTTGNNYTIQMVGGQPILFQNGIDQLIEGVENMQVLYGIDTAADADQTPNYYISAPTNAEWLNVTSIRVSLLLRTIDDNITDQPLTYTFNGTTEANTYDPVTGALNNPPTDRRIRRVFTSTFALRNRLP